MKNRFCLLAPIVFVGLTFWACGSGNDANTIDADFPDRMDALLQEAVADPRNIDAEKAATYLAEAERYADVRTGDTSAVYYLFKAAEVATVQRQYAKAVELYGRIENEFSSHPRAPQALFMQAFTYDENLGQLETAREKYQQFIAKYPQHDFADDAQVMLDNLGKSDEEILRELEADPPAETEE